MNHRYGTRLGIEEILYAYTFKRHSASKYYFMAYAKPLQLVVNLSTTSKNKPQGNVMILGVWGCAEDLILRKYKINLDPELSRALGHPASSFSIPCYFAFSSHRVVFFYSVGF